MKIKRTTAIYKLGGLINRFHANMVLFAHEKREAAYKTNDFDENRLRATKDVR